MRSTTTVLRTSGQRSSASSTTDFSGTVAPLRQPPSAVSTTRASQSRIRVASASAENPPNTTVCGAPMRAQASIAMTVSGTIGM